MFQLTRDEAFAKTARDTLEYVRRDMTHEGGAFFSAEDADSLPSHEDTHKEEGAFYVWTKQKVSGAWRKRALFNSFMGVKPYASTRERRSAWRVRGKNILHRTRGLEKLRARSRIRRKTRRASSRKRRHFLSARKAPVAAS
jgi:uncharacterized protein YyaL (SSP411 family)